MTSVEAALLVVSNHIFYHSYAFLLSNAIVYRADDFRRSGVWDRVTNIIIVSFFSSREIFYYALILISQSMPPPSGGRFTVHYNRI